METCKWTRWQSDLNTCFPLTSSGSTPTTPTSRSAGTSTLACAALWAWATSGRSRVRPGEKGSSTAKHSSRFRECVAARDLQLCYLCWFINQVLDLIVESGSLIPRLSIVWWKKRTNQRHSNNTLLIGIQSYLKRERCTTTYFFNINY